MLSNKPTMKGLGKMSANISVVNGRAEMFSGNNVVPWHKQGTVVSGLATAARR
jgi:hypothetical protein